MATQPIDVVTRVYHMIVVVWLDMGEKFFFFERTTLDEYVSIDVAEKKYKVISLGGHNKAPKTKHKKHTDGLDWDFNARRTQTHSGRSDWVWVRNFTRKCGFGCQNR